ncbi:hypothetical protein LG208_13535 [Bacillus paralicheniformis]|uniref:hypothetical protein n=1 Tax=Bacillus TaxID=1386 RepID=UPI00057BF19E|nr:MULTISPECIES: hypothetical protein [Bacillus]MBZ5212937.1 hypothetical protein [Bacillus paralicheniformis]MCY1630926.1 hypothetical protein [Bacillus paralicheniformis]
MYNPYDYYISPEEFAKAEANGISKDTVVGRIRRQGWDKQRALSEPVRFADRSRFAADWAIYGKVAERNGVSRAAFRVRVYRGWSAEKAASTPKVEKKEQIKRMTERSPRTKYRKFPEEVIKLAESNGIRYGTLRSRVTRNGWDMHIAATTPVMTQQEIQRKAVQAFKRKYGDNPMGALFPKIKGVKA